MNFRTTILLATAACCCLAYGALAAGPALINYQGMLTDDAGRPLDGTYDLTFKLWGTPGPIGVAFWTEVHPGVVVQDGLFSVILGSVTPFTPLAFSQSTRYLGITVGNDPELVPRLRLTSAPWAMNAAAADSAAKAVQATHAAVADSAGTTAFALRASVADTALVGIGGGADSDWTIAAPDMFAAVSGNVGIGTSAPGRKLQVGSNTTSDSEGMIRLGSRSGTNGSNRIWDIGVPETDGDSGGIGYSFILDDTQNTTPAELMVKFGTGHVGIGTTAPTAPLHVVRPIGSTATETMRLQTDFEVGGFPRSTTMTFEEGSIDVTSAMLATGLSLNPTSDRPVRIGGGGGDVIIAAGGGDVEIAGGGGDLILAAGGGDIIIPAGAGRIGIGTDSPQRELDVAGTVRVSILEISGADLAEKFPVSEQGEPGTVVVIDPDNAGSLRPSRGSYDTRVAGVISGAGGLSVGAVLGQCTPDEDAQAIAMSGRVWTYCDASEHAIEPGDLLTTAGRAGHAMKAFDSTRSHGAVLGKAMTRLAKGETGLVLVLINLQ
ncbi:MAG: hypothetical protein IH621_16535 [Krumholzibacteria bacterium]|nr:hypothetical protein [Candidatus Krumholzibacteria bacterium]